MISVEWTTANRPNLWRSGWSFKDENDVICRKHRGGQYECLNWRQYAKWYVENGPAIAVWVNGELAWHYQWGDFLDLDKHTPKQINQRV